MDTEKKEKRKKIQVGLAPIKSMNSLILAFM